MLYPPKGLCKAEPNGVHFDSFHFIVSREGCWHFQIYRGWEAFLKSWKCFIPRRDSAKQSPMGSIWYSSILLCLEKGVGTFKFAGVRGLFEILKMFYPPKGLCEAEPEWGPFDNSFHLLCLEKGVGTFKFSGGERPFWNLENVLSPEGTLRSRTRMGSIWYSFHFIVSREGC